MSRFVLLDTGILGLLTHTNWQRIAKECARWTDDLILAGDVPCVPEICDYEIRRELLRMRRQKSLHRLERLLLRFQYLPISTDAMRQAAQFWADARTSGYPTSSSGSLDADVILAAQAAIAEIDTGMSVVVATTLLRTFLATSMPAPGKTFNPPNHRAPTPEP